MKTVLRTLVLGFAWGLPILSADEYAVQKLDEAPPATLAKEIADQLSPSGIRVTRDGSNFCDLWMCKTWVTKPDFKPTLEIAYPFKPGQFVGVVKYARRGADFRNQDINSGVYTLRYALQPVNGSHVGTSLTRDFWLLTKAKDDKSTDILDYDTLTSGSSEAAGSAHPALLCLLKPAENIASFPSIRHDEERDWWIVAVQGRVDTGKDALLPVEIVIAGRAAE